MANNSASGIRGAIKEKLLEVTQLQTVKIGRSIDFSGYPACRFYLSGITDELIDNTPSNFRTYQFTIEIIQEITSKDVPDAEADFQDAIDAVLDKLNAQWTLGSNVDVSIVDGGSVAIVESDAGPVVVCAILLSAKTLIS
jgi:hypothetical protein